MALRFLGVRLPPPPPGSPADAALVADRLPPPSVVALQTDSLPRYRSQSSPCATAPLAAGRAPLHCWSVPRRTPAQRSTAPRTTSSARGTAPPLCGPDSPAVS